MNSHFTWHTKYQSIAFRYNFNAFLSDIFPVLQYSNHASDTVSPSFLSFLIESHLFSGWLFLTFMHETHICPVTYETVTDKFRCNLLLQVIVHQISKIVDKPGISRPDAVSCLTIARHNIRHIIYIPMLDKTERNGIIIK